MHCFNIFYYNCDLSYVNTDLLKHAIVILSFDFIYTSSSSSSSIGTTTLGGFRPAQLSLIILSRKVLKCAVANGTSNPQLGGEPVI
jgi:hypothetical protein